MSGFKPYPAYRDSGVEWLGEVPKHWELHKLKHVATFSGGGTPSRENLSYWSGDIPWVSPKDMKREVIDSAEETITDEGLKNSTSSLISAGRALLVVRSGILKHTIPVAINSVPVALNQDMKALSFNPRALTSQFFLRWVQGLNDSLLKAWLKQGATVESIEHDYLIGTEIPLPPIVEQKVISNFLDHETARIDALIAEQQRLIELLKEKRQAVISHAVTKGLDPSVPMKDSGVEWLGEVPAHWEVKKLGFIGEAIIGLTYSPADVADDGILVLRSSNVQQGKISFLDNVYVQMEVLAKLMVKPDDILICSRNGSRELIGKNAWIDESADGMTFGAFMTIFRSPINNFIFQVFNSNIFSAQAGSFMTSTVNQLTTGNLNSFLIPLPPREEQISIASYLRSVRADFEGLISQALAGIKLLQERRSALISAAVTGKIDLRGWQPPAGTPAPLREQETA